MSWIKIRTNLVSDPAVAAIGIRIRAHPRQVVGCLVAVWCWADPLTADGWVPHATARLIDEVAGRKDFANALAAVGWLSIEPDGVRFPRWDRHNSQSAKARAGEVERKRLQRSEPAAPSRPDTMSGQTSGQNSGHFPDQRRGEEIRGDKSIIHPSSCGEPSETASPPAGVPGELSLGLPANDTNPVEDPVFLTYPTVGEIKEWPLRESKVREYETTFPGMDARAELRRARQWCVDTPARRKTAGGMLRFLFGWLERKQNDGRGGGSSGKSSRGPSWK